VQTQHHHCIYSIGHWAIDQGMIFYLLQQAQLARARGPNQNSLQLRPGWHGLHHGRSWGNHDLVEFPNANTACYLMVTPHAERAAQRNRAARAMPPIINARNRFGPRARKQGSGTWPEAVNPSYLALRTLPPCFRAGLTGVDWA